jgi:hypothetical protein
MAKTCLEAWCETVSEYLGDGSPGQVADHANSAVAGGSDKLRDRRLRALKDAAAILGRQYLALNQEIEQRNGDCTTGNR